MQNDLNSLSNESEGTYVCAFKFTDHPSWAYFFSMSPKSLESLILVLIFPSISACSSPPFSEKKYEIVNEKGLDVFGCNTNQVKKQCECICPTCQRPISAQRFAPHLEKCMGMGRNSSRIAIKRIASVTGKCDDSDEEITYQRKVKKKKINNSKKNNGSNNFNNGLAI